jgi:mannose-6-phosphate isomerase-like protein (cupin superfamily)
MRFSDVGILFTTMKPYIRLKDVPPMQAPGHASYPLLDERHGCVKGCKTGVSIYLGLDWSPAGVHDDQEGFIVLEGRGWAKLGGEEFPLEPDTCFMAPAGTPHAMKRNPDTPRLKLFWFHAAV